MLFQYISSLISVLLYARNEDKAYSKQVNLLFYLIPFNLVSEKLMKLFGFNLEMYINSKIIIKKSDQRKNL